MDKKSRQRNTGQVLLEGIELVQQASANRQVLHFSHSFSENPGESGIVVCFVTCPDAVVGEMQRALDKVVNEIFADHGMTPRKPQ